ncbi:uncharacterized protein LOC115216459 isoform X2 [Argonauta hians]
MGDPSNRGSPALFNASRGSNDDRLGTSANASGSPSKLPWGSPFSPANQPYVSPMYSSSPADSNRSRSYENRGANHYFQQRHGPRGNSPISTSYNCHSPLFNPRSYPHYQQEKNCFIPRGPSNNRQDKYSRHSTPYGHKVSFNNSRSFNDDISSYFKPSMLEDPWENMKCLNG